jgi:hypothetical protein
MPKSPQENSIVLNSPSAGVIRSISREETVPNSCADALNVLPFDLLGRKRIASRFGTSIFTESGGTGAVQGMINFGFILPPGSFIGSTSTFSWNNFQPTLTNISSGYLYSNAASTNNLNASWSVMTGPNLVMEYRVSATCGVPSTSGTTGESFATVTTILPLNAVNGAVENISTAFSVASFANDSNQVTFTLSSPGSALAIDIPNWTGTTPLPGSTYTQNFVIAFTPNPVAGVGVQISVDGQTYSANTVNANFTPSTWGPLSVNTAFQSFGGVYNSNASIEVG